MRIKERPSFTITSCDAAACSISFFTGSKQQYTEAPSCVSNRTSPLFVVAPSAKSTLLENAVGASVGNRAYCTNMPVRALSESLLILNKTEPVSPLQIP